MATPAREPTLADRVASVSWYHSLPLPGGLVTPGSFDNLDELSRVPFPSSLAGKRCLDVATADGFWAYEMERRGAPEVVAIDVRDDHLDWPPGAGSSTNDVNQRQLGERGFDIAHAALESSVQWREMSAYELDPDVIGEFDFVFIGSLLCHLRDPVAALSAVRRVVRGEMLSVDAISLPLTVVHPRQPLARLETPGWPLWWVPNLRCYRGLFTAARLEILESGRPFFLKRGPAYRPAYGPPSVVNQGGLNQRLRRAVSARVGNLHAWVRAAAPDR
jgi:tRNA (mo5U34)-methyltransferase